MNSGGLVFGTVARGSYRNIYSADTYNDGNWYGVAISHNVTTGEMVLATSLNGGTFATDSNIPGIPATEVSPRILMAVLQTYANPWDGIMDELKIYDRALTSDEILQVFNGGFPWISDGDCLLGDVCYFNKCIALEDVPCDLPCDQGTTPDLMCEYCIIDSDPDDNIRLRSLVSEFSTSMSTANYNSDLKLANILTYYQTGFNGKFSLPRYSVPTAILNAYVVVNNETPLKFGMKPSTLSSFNTATLTSFTMNFQADITSWSKSTQNGTTSYTLTVLA